MDEEVEEDGMNNRQVVHSGLKRWKKRISNFLLNMIKVYISWEGHKIFRNLKQLLLLSSASQIIGGDFAKFCGLLTIYEL